MPDLRRRFCDSGIMPLRPQFIKELIQVQYLVNPAYDQYPELKKILEKNYRAAVYVNDPGVNKSNVSVATNLGINLAVEYNSEHPELSAVPNQATYIYNNTNANQNKVKEILSITGFNEQVTKDRLMDVTVDVYPKGTKISELNTQKPVVTMTGGMTN